MARETAGKHLWWEYDVLYSDPGIYVKVVACVAHSYAI